MFPRPWPVILIAIAAGLLLLDWLPPLLPAPTATTQVATVVLVGSDAPAVTNAPELSDVPAPFGDRGPLAGNACLDRITRGEGWLDLCWQAWHLDGTPDSASDYYVLRLFGTYASLKWVAVQSSLSSPSSMAIVDTWPTGSYGGSCTVESISLLVPMSALGAEGICGRTDGTFDATAGTQTVTWRCRDCLLTDPRARSFGAWEVVAVTTGAVPGWTLFADVGS